jgi:hypothetical protein
VTPEQFRIWGRAVVDVLAGFVGLGILVYETLWEHVDRPWLLGVAATILGFPFFSYVDRLLKSGPSGYGRGRDEEP